MVEAVIDLDLLEQIYDVALGHSSWDDVMARLRTGFAAEAGLLIAYGQGPEALSALCRSGYEEAVVQAYAEHFEAIDPYVAAMKSGALPTGRIMFGDDLVPAKVFCDSEYYNDWFRPNGMRYTAGGQVQNRDGLHLMVALPRSHASGPYTPEDVRRLQTYFNHIGRSFEIQDAIKSGVSAPDFDEFALRYKLTPAEVKLVVHLVDTGGLKQCAEHLHCSYNTVRAHLRSVFEKTQTHSQPQLLRLIHQPVSG